MIAALACLQRVALGVIDFMLASAAASSTYSR
jgi:hypothetical protein